jgi:hypothetical protein
LCQGMTRLVTTHWHRPCLPHNAGIGDTHSCQSCGDKGNMVALAVDRRDENT